MGDKCVPQERKGKCNHRKGDGTGRMGKGGHCVDRRHHLPHNPTPSPPTPPTHPHTHTHTRIRTHARTHAQGNICQILHKCLFSFHTLYLQITEHDLGSGGGGGGGGEEEEERKYRSRYTSRRPDLVDTENCFLWWNSWPIDGRWHCFVVVFFVVVLRERVSPQTDR